MRKKAGITVVNTEFQHNELSDRGPDRVKTTVLDKLLKFIDDDGAASPQQTDKPKPADPFGLITASSPP